MAYTNKQIAQVYANNKLRAGSAGGKTLFFKDKVAYSYGSHFPIAVLVHNYGFVTTDKYSVTTSRHTNLIRLAITQSYKRLIELPNLKNIYEELQTLSINANSETRVEIAKERIKDYLQEEDKKLSIKAKRALNKIIT